MRISSWNVNSVRARADRIANFLERSEIDVLCIQETKAKDEQFPCELFERLGYEVVHFGLSQWNGVAIASRVGIEEIQRGFPNQPEFKDVVEARAIGATCGGVRAWSLYVPNGRALDDPHYPYKLEWLATLKENMKTELETNSEAKIILAGDWNIAPTDIDVWDMAAFEGHTHVSDKERKAFQEFLNLGFTDSGRTFYGESGKYTYWDYKALSFPKKKGMRIDFMLTSKALNVKEAWVDRE
jgi:exodeoxyribonuclease III